MAFNVQALKTRTLTAAVFVMVMVIGVVWSPWSFFLLFTIIHFGCWFEYQRICALIDKDYLQISPFHKYGVMIAGWCIMLYFTNDAFRIGALALHSIGWWLGLIFIFILPITEILFARQLLLKNIGYSLLGLLYISVSWGLMMDLRTVFMQFNNGVLVYDRGFLIPSLLILSIWINDTMAYIVGSLIGKTPFSKISPKKTWEGTIGGALLCVIVVAVLCRVFSILPLKDAVVISALAAITGTAGDLLESKLKRMAGVKDSGSIMPGHGGFLDRFDSLIVATPFVWFYVMLFVAYSFY